MTFDLLVRNATLPDGRTGLDIAVQDGRIAAVERGIEAQAGRVIDAHSRLVSTGSPSQWTRTVSSLW